MEADSSQILVWTLILYVSLCWEKLRAGLRTLKYHCSKHRLSTILRTKAFWLYLILSICALADTSGQYNTLLWVFWPADGRLVGFFKTRQKCSRKVEVPHPEQQPEHSDHWAVSVKEVSYLLLNQVVLPFCSLPVSLHSTEIQAYSQSAQSRITSQAACSFVTSLW